MKDILAHSVLAKVLMLAALTLFAALPLGSIHRLIHERGASRDQAAADLAASHAGPQVIAGPVIVVPYVERWTEVQLDDKGAVKTRTTHARQRAHLVFPESSHLKGRLTPQQRYRGIFTVLFYDLQGRLSGRFPAFDTAALPRHVKDSVLEPQAPVLALSLGDVRGLQGSPALSLAGAAARWAPRVPALPDNHALASGIHAPLPAAALEAWRKGAAIPFTLDLTLVGQERLSIVPLADETTAHLVSAWPHPSFGGEFLALRRQVADTGFEAEWAVSSLVSSARAQVSRDGKEAVAVGSLDSFDVSLVEPLNVYALASRAAKYGLLFVALTLLAAFMFDLFRKLRLHPVQYGLVGLSITLFFLLLVALSEKMAFGFAYAAAAGASTLLLTIYFSAVLHGLRRGLGLGVYIGVLYAALYGLLSSEDNALLMGALLLFSLLALLMVGTRRVDWSTLSAKPAPAPARSA